MKVSRQTTYKITTDRERFTLGQLRQFFDELPKDLSDDTSVGITSYDSQRDGYRATVSITLTEES